MKQIIMVIVIIITACAYSNGQGTVVYPTATSAVTINPVQLDIHASFSDSITKNYAYYMHKRKIQKTIGWSLLGSGFAFGGIGILLTNINNNRSGYTYDESHSNDGNAAAICFLLSAATGIASIPFMIMAGNSKYKAQLLMVSQKTGYGIPLRSNGSVTGICLKIPIGKTY